MKVPISDTFDQLTASSIDNSLFQKIASFVVPTDQQKINIIEPNLIQNRFNEVSI
jgi:hypothetical protein